MRWISTADWRLAYVAQLTLVLLLADLRLTSATGHKAPISDRSNASRAVDEREEIAAEEDAKKPVAPDPIVTHSAVSAHADDEKGRVQYSSSEPASVELLVLGRRVLQGSPGDVLTIAFRLLNPGRDTLKVAALSRSPIGWRSTPGSLEVAIPGGESAVRLASIAIPSGAKAGRYVIGFSTEQSGSRFDPNTQQVEVEVRQVRAFSMDILRAPSHVRPGSTSSVRVRIHNRGNGTEHIEVMADPDKGSAHPRSSVHTIHPDQASDVTIQLTSPSVKKSPATQILRIRSRAADGSISNEASVAVVVVPEPVLTSRPFVPITFKSGFSGGGSGGSLYMDLESSWRIPSSDIQMDARLRLPDSRQASAFAQRDTYQMMLTGKHARVRLGDHVSSSNLMFLVPTWGFGAGADVTKGAYRFGGSRIRDRIGRSSESRLELFGEHRSGHGDFGLHLTHETGAHDGSALAATFARQLSNDFQIRLQAGTSLNDPTGGTSLAAAFNADRKQVDVDAQYIRVATGHPGSFAGVDQRYLSTRISPKEGMSIDASYRGSIQQREEWRTGHHALRTGVSANLAHIVAGSSAQFHVRHESYSLEGITSRPARSLTSVLGRLAWSSRTLSTSISAERGVARSPGRPFHEVAVQAAVTVGRFRISGAARSHSGASLFSGTGLSQTNWNSAAQWRISKRSSLSAQWTYATYRRIILFHQHLISARWNLDLQSGRVISLEGRQYISEATGFTAPEYHVSYSMPLQAPLVMKSSDVFGRVADAATGDGFPSVLVRLGNHVAMTDSSGRYRFRGVPEGRYIIAVDPVGIPATYTTLATREESVQVVRGESLRRDFDFIESGVITGRVVWEGGEPSRFPISVVLSDGSQRYYARPDEQGRFVFSGIGPGAWEAALLNLEAELKSTPVLIEIEAGDEEKVELIVTREVRVPAIIRSGVLRRQ